MNPPSVETLERDDLIRVFVENSIDFVPASIEHLVEFSRRESARLSVFHVRCEHVRSPLHLIARQMGLWFPSFPPSEPEVAAKLATYRPEFIGLPAIVEALRSHIESMHGPLPPEVDVALRLQPVRWAARLVNEWNDVLACCRTDDEYVIVAYSDSA